MAEYRVVSTDDHVVEPPHAWQNRVAGALRDRAPKIVKEDGRDVWVVDGEKWGKGVGGLGAIVGRPYQEYTPDPFPRGYADMRPGCYEPRARLQDMDVDGVDAEVIYPSLPGLGGQAFLKLKDTNLRLACIRAYNDFVAEEFCAADHHRLVPLTIVPYWDVQAVVAEVKRAHAKGHRGVVFSAAPETMGFKPIHDTSWDPLWHTLQELDVPVHLHIGSGQMPAVLAPLQIGSGATGMAFVITALTSNVVIMASVIFSGLLERFPGLKVVSVESGIGWVPYFMELADDTYARQRFWTGTTLTMLPSDYFHRQVYVNFWNEKAPLKNRHLIGLENILWESDYPHSICSWPNSRTIIQDNFEGVPEAEKRQILAGNAARLYHLS